MSATPRPPVPGRSRLRAGMAAACTGSLLLSILALPATAAGPAVGPGTYENSSSALAYVGAWTTTSSTAASGGSFASLSADGSADLTFSAPGVRWLARTNAYAGMAEVYLDGAKQATVDLYSASTINQKTVYEVSGLTGTTHTLSIRRTGTKNPLSGGASILLDALVVVDAGPPAAPTGLTAAASGTGARLTWNAGPESDVVGYRLYRTQSGGARTKVADLGSGVLTATDPDLFPGTAYRYQVSAVDAGGDESPASTAADLSTPISPQPAGTYEDGSAALRLVGPWTTVSSTADSGGTHAELAADGFAELAFGTSGVQLLARTNAYGGLADVYLDGTLVKTVDLYSAGTLSRQRIWEVTGLSETPHSVRLVRTGRKNASSGGANISVDAVVAPDVHAPATPSGLSVAVSGTGATARWTASPEPDLAGYRLYRDTGAGTTRVLLASPTATALSYTDPGLQPGTLYRYQLAAVDASGNVSDPSAAVSVSTPINPQGPGTYEDGNPALTLSGPWSTTTSSLDSGGSSVSLAGPGYAELSFASSGIRVLARTNAYAGIVDVYLDGQKQAGVDLYSAATAYQRPVYEVSGLSESDHTLRLVYTGSKSSASGGRNVLLDALVVADLKPPAAPTGVTATPAGSGVQVQWTASPESDVTGYRVYRVPASGPALLVATVAAGTVTATDADLFPGTAYRYQVGAVDVGGLESPPSATATATTPIDPQPAGTYEDGAAAVRLSGDWTTVGSTADSGGSHAELAAEGYAQVSFATSGLQVLARTNPYGGLAEVYLDGTLVQTVDLYSAATVAQAVVYTVTGLPETAHSVRLVRTGRRNPASSGSTLSLDAFVAPDLHAPAAPTGVAAAAEGTGVTVTWAPSPEPDIASFRLYRSGGGTADEVLVASPAAGDRQRSDPDLTPATTYSYRLVAVDTSGNASDHSAVATATTAVTAHPAGTYENTSPALTLVGPWTVNASSQDSGGSHSALSGTGFAELSFNTSGISWIARRNAYAGIADVYLDGQKRASVDLYAATTAPQQTVWSVSGLSESTHTLRISYSGTKSAASAGRNVLLDALVVADIYPPAAPAGVTASSAPGGARLVWAASPEPDVVGYRVYRAQGSDALALVAQPPSGTTSLVDADLFPGTAYRYRVSAVDAAGNESALSSTASLTTTITAQGAGSYEDFSPQVRMVGPWTAAASTADSGGTHAELAEPGYAELAFATSGVQVLGRTNPYGGLAEVYLDGVLVQTVDLYSATTASQQVLWQVEGLPETPHSVRLVRTGRRNPASAGANLTLDAFVAPDLHPPAPPTGLSATVSGTGARLTWTASADTDVAYVEIYRREGTGSRIMLTTRDSGTLSLDDQGLKPGAAYRYDLVAVDGSGNASAASGEAQVSMPIQLQGPGTYEDTSPEVTLSGSWATTTSTADSGGSFSTLGSSGYAELSFRTSGIRWMARKNPYGGIVDVYLDGVRQTPVDLYSASTLPQQKVFEVTGLPETSHTLRIAYTGTRNASSGGRNVLLDSFVVPDIHPPAAPAGLQTGLEPQGVRLTWTASPEPDVTGYRLYRQEGATTTKVVVNPAPVAGTSYLDMGLNPGAAYRYQVSALDAGGNESPLSTASAVTTPIVGQGSGTYENVSPVVKLSGPWTTVTASSDSGGSYASTNGAGYAELSFQTSGIRWLARTNAYGGMAQVYLDGVLQATVDLYSSTTRYQQTVYEASGLPETEHTIRVVRTGTRNPLSGGTNLFLDAFVAPDIYPPGPPAGLQWQPEAAGARVSWAANPEPDVATYRVYRQQGSDPARLVGTVDAGTTSFLDAGLADATTYGFSVAAVDRSGNVSPTSAALSVLTPAAAPDPTRRYATCPAATVNVSNRAQLVLALARAGSGTVIRLAPGVYTGQYDVNLQASDAAPIWVCGPRTAVIDGGNVAAGAGLRIDSSTNLVFAGMTVRNALKGIAVINSRAVTVADVRVEDIGDEAIHLRTNTTDSTVIGNSIARTGLTTPAYGEGVYIGTAAPNWCTYSGCAPDRSDRNAIIGNDISATTAEQIEAKEGATHGLMARNTLDGTGMSSNADSLLAIQSNDWTVTGNRGVNTPLDGLQVWEQGAGWGMRNVAYANQFGGTLPGYGVRLAANELGNIVGCDTVVPATSLGISNKSCQS